MTTLTKGLMFNIIAVVTSIAIALTSLEFILIETKDLMMVILSLASLPSLYSIMKVIWEDSNKGESNHVLRAFIWVCIIWGLFGIVYNEPSVIVLNCIWVSYLSFILIRKRRYAGLIYSLPYSLLFVLALCFQNELFNFAQIKIYSNINIALAIEFTAGFVELYPFLQKLFELKNKQYKPESTQAYIEFLPMYLGWFSWHIVSETYVAATLVLIALISIILIVSIEIKSSKNTKVI